MLQQRERIPAFPVFFILFVIKLLADGVMIFNAPFRWDHIGIFWFILPPDYGALPLAPDFWMSVFVSTGQMIGGWAEISALMLGLLVFDAAIALALTGLIAAAEIIDAKRAA